MNILAGIPIIGDLIKTVFGSKLKRDAYQADARSAVYSQFAAEFGHGKTWWDSLIDGLNRLPRPIMTFGTIWIFYYAISDPVNFAISARALAAMPKEGWYILGAVVTFWFAAKLPKDFGKYKVQQGAIEIAKEVHSAREGSDKSLPTNVETEHEIVDWSERKEKRYKTDWDNLND